MQIFINDQAQEVSAQTLADLLKSLGVAQEPAVAAALNGQVVPRSQWPQHHLQEGARVLIIRAAQGG
ncbi:MAG: sulfur carrier protein ThiS [Verrucomicrobia bacterium]|nr:sulfur carrier protein ThiS [Verrucomicrobiota bacterium]